MSYANNASIINKLLYIYILCSNILTILTSCSSKSKITPPLNFPNKLLCFAIFSNKVLFSCLLDFQHSLQMT